MGKEIEPEVSEQIDIIYTWVDGSDPVWREKRAKASHQSDPACHLATANVEGRFRDNGELRCNFRALQQHFSNHGRIFLVTDQQVPRWLSKDHGITLVDHADILDEEGRPTFSSLNIEACLHRIEGLSERYIYFNDDIFLCRQVDERDFFTDSGIVFYASSRVLPRSFSGAGQFTAPDTAAHSIVWLEKHGFDNINRNLPGHAPMPVIKSTMIELETAFPELFHRARRERFRQRDSFSLLSDLYYRWMIATGRGVMRLGSSAYFESGDKDFGAALEKFRQRPASDTTISFCINDTSDNKSAEEIGPAQQLMAEFLAVQFPLSSH